MPPKSCNVTKRNDDCRRKDGTFGDFFGYLFLYGLVTAIISLVLWFFTNGCRYDNILCGETNIFAGWVLSISALVTIVAFSVLVSGSGITEWYLDIPTGKFKPGIRLSDASKKQ